MASGTCCPPLSAGLWGFLGLPRLRLPAFTGGLSLVSIFSLFPLFSHFLLLSHFSLLSLPWAPSLASPVLWGPWPQGGLGPGWALVMGLVLVLVLGLEVLLGLAVLLGIAVVLLVE